MLKIIGVLSSLSDRHTMSEYADELLLESLPLSRLGELTLEECADIAANSSLRCILAWDILMTEDKLKSCCLKVSSYLKRGIFDGVRVQDPGALHFIKKQFPAIKIQLILESGNHNLLGLKEWAQRARPQLEKLILSVELPRTKLAHFIKELNCPVEILGLGRILLFYTPRNLLSPYFSQHDDGPTEKLHQSIEGVCHSEESAHKGFPVVENAHGTFMFNTKFLYLLEYCEQLKEMGLDSLRVDLRGLKVNDTRALGPLIRALFNSFNAGQAQFLKNSFAEKSTVGFFLNNKTDVLFKKLKNKRRQRQDDFYLGDIIEVRKKKYLAVKALNKSLPLKCGQKVVIKTPDGKEKKMEIKKMQNTCLEEILVAEYGQVALIPHTGGVSVRSSLYAYL